MGGPAEMPKRRSLFRQHFQRPLSIVLVLYKERRRLDRHRFSFGSGAVFGLLCFGAHLAVSLLAVADARHFDMLAEIAEDHAMIRGAEAVERRIDALQSPNVAFFGIEEARQRAEDLNEWQWVEEWRGGRPSPDR